MQGYRSPKGYIETRYLVKILRDGVLTDPMKIDDFDNEVPMFTSYTDKSDAYVAVTEAGCVGRFVVLETLEFVPV